MSSVKYKYNFLIPEDIREKRINEHLNSAANTSSKDFAIMYLLVHLSQFFQRSPEYFLKTVSEQQKIYEKDFSVVRDGPDQYVVCKTICEKYKKYFAMLGIESEIIKLPTNSGIPLYSMLVTGDDGKIFFIDPLSDLQMNQFGLRMDYFGDYSQMHKDTILKIAPTAIQLPREYITELEENFGSQFYENQDKIIAMHRLYSNVSYDGTISTKKDADSVRLNSMEQKIQLASDKIINMSSFGSAVNGIIERKKFYQMILSRYSIFTKRERNGGNGIKFFINRDSCGISIDCLLFGIDGQEQIQYREDYLECEKKYILRRIE